MSLYEDEIPDSGEPELWQLAEDSPWLVKHTHWRARGFYLCPDGYWRSADALGKSIDSICYASREEAELALAKHNLLESALPGSTWRSPGLVPTEGTRMEPKQAAQLWLLLFCDRYRADLHDLVEASLNGEGYCFGDDDGPDAARQPEFWDNLRLATGREPKDPEETYFRCAC